MGRYTLVDVVERAEKFSTFSIPPLEERATLAPGDYAKLVFDDAERMWVKVTRVNDDGSYRGVLDNDPVIVELKPGAKVTFSPQHVCAILRGPTDDLEVIP